MRFAAALCVALASAVSAAATTTVVDISPRGVRERFLYVRADAPVANVVVIPGNDGVLGIQDDGTMTTLTSRCNPVARNRDAFAARGFSVALMDQAADGWVGKLEDVRGVVDYMRARDNVPAWVIGGSSSTGAILTAASGLPSELPLGVIFFSPQGGTSASASTIRRPTLVVYHVLDPNPLSTGALYSGLTNAPARQLVALSGGSNGGCGYHLFNGLDAEFIAATAGFIDAYNGSFAPTIPGLNQHGLGGVWYEPASSGQGFALEVFPDLSGPGSGLVAGGWFTYDVAPGGADKQRWYTISGPMSNGAASAAVTIYRNIGGNFDAGPRTSAESVGTGTLSFSTCDAGQLAYTFTDGRTGSIALARITSNVECSPAAAGPPNADFGLSGNWFNEPTSGQGLVVEVNPASGVLFLAWYTYAPDGAASGAAGQRWYTGQGAYTAGARSIAVTLYETKGGVFDTPTPAGQTTTAVGTATLTFASCASAALAYAFTGGSSAGISKTIALQRAGPAPAGCAF
jgi:hypothetical protein